MKETTITIVIGMVITILGLMCFVPKYKKSKGKINLAFVIIYIFFAIYWAIQIFKI